MISVVVRFFCLIVLGLLGIVFVVTSYRTQYGAQGDWVGGQAISNPTTDAYYSDLRSSLKDELTRLGFQQVSALPNEFGFQTDLRPGDTIWKAPQDHFFAILCPDVYAGSVEGKKTVGFDLNYDYFERCWQWQSGRLSRDEEGYRVSLQEWYREYSKTHPPTFWRASTFAL